MYLHSISQLVILLGSRPEGKTNKYIKAISGYNMLIKASQWGYTSGVTQAGRTQGDTK